MTDFDQPLTEIQEGDVLTITFESGETFEEVTVSHLEKEYVGEKDEYGLLTASFHGDLWEQVQDRVDSEELELRADSKTGTCDWTWVRVSGIVWKTERVFDPREKRIEKESVTDYVDLDTVQNVERVE